VLQRLAEDHGIVEQERADDLFEVLAVVQTAARELAGKLRNVHAGSEDGSSQVRAAVPPHCQRRVGVGRLIDDKIGGNVDRIGQVERGQSRLHLFGERLQQSSIRHKWTAHDHSETHLLDVGGVWLENDTALDEAKLAGAVACLDVGEVNRVLDITH